MESIMCPMLELIISTSSNALRKTFADRKHIIVESQTDYYDGSKTTRELDIQYNSFEDVVLSTVNSVKHFY
jgi:hypothetical protein